MSLYDRPGIAAAYRAARRLPIETAALWVDVIRRALGDLTVRLALDVGAGTGRFTRVLADAVRGPVVAVEPAAGMIEEREVVDAPAVRYVRAVGEALPLRDGTADVALLSMSYHQLNDPGAARAELRRVVRRRGRVLLRTPTLETLGDFAWAPFFPESVAFDVPRMPSRDGAIEAFRDAGFTCREHAVVRQRIVSNLAALAARIRTRSLSSMQALPDDLWERRLAAFEAHCRTAPDGPVDEPMNLFVFEAR